MSNEITMPKLSDTMEEGKILRWLKHQGDTIRRGEPIAEVETDKADMVLEAFDDGVLDEIRLKEGESAEVGAVIALLRPAPGATLTPAQPSRSVSREPSDAEASKAHFEPRPSRVEREPRTSAASAESGSQLDERNSEIDHEAHPALSANPSAKPTAIVAPPRTLNQPDGPTNPGSGAMPATHQLRASPLARRAAEEAGIDLSQIRGTGPEDRITKRDVDNFLRERELFKVRRLVSPREGAPGSTEELSKMRKSIVLRMTQSKREIPHFYVTVEVDMEQAVQLRKSLETTKVLEEPITFNDIIVKACALALGRYPRINASFNDDRIIIHPQINIGIAVAVEDGLLLPVIRKCEQLTLPEIARAAHGLVLKAEHGGFTSPELSGATFSISNLGMLDIEHFSAVIVPPQAAILAVSAIKQRPVIRDGEIVVGTTMMITMSCDHRIIDGVVAGRFLQELKRLLENPASLLV